MEHKRGLQGWAAILCVIELVTTTLILEPIPEINESLSHKKQSECRLKKVDILPGPWIPEG